LSDLVSALAVTSGLPEATVFAYGRFAREAGHISQKGRGNAAASMTATDAANLLLAVAGTPITRDAGKAIEQNRPLQGRFIEQDGDGKKIVEWLEPLGMRKRRDRGDSTYWYKLEADLGQLLEFLISEAKDGHIAGVLRKIPVLAIENPGLEKPLIESVGLPTELLVERGGKTIDPKDINVGSDVNIKAVVNRVHPHVEIKFTRTNWYTLPSFKEIFFGIDFWPKSDLRWDDLDIEASFSIYSIAALGAALAGRPIPKKNWRLLFPQDDPKRAAAGTARKGGAA
jgi:hypothetical protein